MFMFKRRKTNIVVFGAVITLAAFCVIAAIIYIFNKTDPTSYAQSAFSMEYTVSTRSDSVSPILVRIDMPISKLSEEKIIRLYLGNVFPKEEKCVDNLGNEVPFSIEGAFLALGPIQDDAASVSYTYSSDVGQKDESSNYTIGVLYDDLLVFKGEDVLITPVLDINEISGSERFTRYIESISLHLEQNRGWTSIMPFATPLDDSCSFKIDSPGWAELNSLSKSAFCFGTFDPLLLDDGSKFFLDRGATDIQSDDLEMLLAFTAFYTRVFGEGLGDTPFVLLRNHTDGALIGGGVGAGAAAVSAKPLVAEDCQTISRTLYYAFFDSKARSMNLRYVSNYWIYRGLCDYYTNASAETLPENIKERFSIEVENTIAAQYLRYLYFSLKDPAFLVLSPTQEETMNAAYEEYYFSSKVPLMIDIINYISWRNTGQSDGLIRGLVANGDQRIIDVEELIEELCGKDKDSISGFFAGETLIPNHRELSLDLLMSNEEIVDEIARYERLFSLLFSMQNIYYPDEPIFLLNTNAFMVAAQSLGVRYNTDQIESHVRGFSKVLDQLLLQYAYRAKLAGVDDITKPGVRGELYDSEATDKWIEFCKEIGIQ